MGGEHSLSADRVTVTPVQCHSEDVWRYAVIPPSVKHTHTHSSISLSNPYGKSPCGSVHTAEWGKGELRTRIFIILLNGQSVAALISIFWPRKAQHDVEALRFVRKRWAGGMKDEACGVSLAFTAAVWHFHICTSSSASESERRTPQADLHCSSS